MAKKYCKACTWFVTPKTCKNDKNRFVLIGESIDEEFGCVNYCKKRKATKKTSLAKRKKDHNSKYWRKKADDLWGEIIRSVNVCLVNDENCAGPFNAHHLIGRSRMVTRHNLKNGVCLCTHHHTFNNRQSMSIHGTPRKFWDWLAANHPKRAAWIELNKYTEGVYSHKKAYEKLNKIVDTRK